MQSGDRGAIVALDRDLQRLAEERGSLGALPRSQRHRPSEREQANLLAGQAGSACQIERAGKTFPRPWWLAHIQLDAPDHRKQLTLQDVVIKPARNRQAFGRRAHGVFDEAEPPERLGER